MQGFDEYMNMVLDEAEEVHMRKAHRKPLGVPLPKGLLQAQHLVWTD